MQSYSPFNSSIQDLCTADLAVLRTVSEGWYVEYKRDWSSASALAKSISALANTYGGWLFLGITEESKANPVAGSFPGISSDQADAVLQRLRKAAADHLNPTPHFETKLLGGPNTDLGLPSDRAVICVWVPQSKTAPHVHSSGQIYRRVSDASEPTPEKDRFVLDQLWRRSDDIRQQHKEWFNRDPELSEHEQNLPYVRLMLVADPWSRRDLWIGAEEGPIRAALSESTGVSAIPFDTVYTYSDGFIGRQLNGNDPENLTLTWRLRRNLVSDVLIPLPLYHVTDVNLLRLQLTGYEHTDRYLKLLRRHQTSTLRVVDLNYLLNVFIGVAEVQDKLCKLASWSDSYYLKIKLLNCWRTTPFIDTTHVLSHVEQRGLPMCLDRTSACPSGTSPENYIEVSRYSEFDSHETRVIVQGMLMFAPLAISFGLPISAPNEEESKDEPYYQALQQAGRRAIEVQRLRNLRQKG